MKTKALLGAAAAAFALPGVSLAEFNYTSVEFSLVDVEYDVGIASIDGDGFNIAGSYTITDNFFIGGEYNDVDFDFGIDGEKLEFGGGYFHPMNDSLDFVASLSYVDVEISSGFASADDDGLALGGGVRAQIAEGFQVDATLKYTDFDSGSDTGVELRGRYYFSDSVAVSLRTDVGSDIEIFSLGIRAEF